MEQIQYQAVQYTNSTTSSTDFIGYTNRVLIRIDSPTSHFGGSQVTMILQGRADSSLTMLDVYYYDYIQGGQQLCQVTAVTAGIYELPNPGALVEYRLKFASDATSPGSVTFIYPKDGY